MPLILLPRTIRFLLLFMIGAGLLLTALPVAAQPTNDDLANAIVINPAMLPYSLTTNSTGATLEPNEDDPNCESGDEGTSLSQWWSFTPTVSGVYTIDTVGTGPTGFAADSVLAVYTAPGLPPAHPLTEIACNDDFSSGGNSRVAPVLTAGVRYFIRVANFNIPQAGTVVLNLALTTPTPTVTLTGGGNVTEGTNATFTVTRTGSTTAALVVTYTVSGTATTPTDYAALPGTVTIPAGQASANIEVPILTESPNGADAAETLTLTLTDTAAYDLGTPSSQTATIAANSLLVTIPGDSGEGSLRQAVDNANTDGVDSTITFSGVSTVTLTSSDLGLGNNGTLTITGGGVTVQRSDAGGTPAFRIFTVNSGANVTLTGLTITGGNAGSGGGINNSLGTLTLNNSTVSGNSASGSGGGIENFGTLTLNNSSVSGNSASFGGGISNQGTLTTLNNSTVSGNTVVNAGGGIENFGTLTLNNSIIANSTGGGDCANSETVTVQHSLIEDGSCGITNGVNGNLTGDPGFEPSTLVPQAGSRVIDAGSDALVPSGITTDLAGNARIQGARVDMGAFEAAPPPPPPTVTLTGGGPVTEGTNATFTVTRTGSTTAALTVNLMVTLGDDLIASDYTLRDPSNNDITTSVTIPAGADNVVLTFTALDDGASAETAESLTIELTGTAAYDLGTPNSATATIARNGLLVTNGNDSGEGSLEQAVINANTDGVDSTITFSGVSTVTRTSGDLGLGNDGTLTITGGGVTVRRDSGASPFRIFTVNSGANVTITGLTITGGSESGIRNEGTLTLNNSTVSGNIAAFGGGIENRGTLTLNNSTVSGNDAGRDGGGIENRGTVTLNNSTVSGNDATNGGGIRNRSSSTLTLNNSIIANSTGGDCSNSGTINASHSLIEDGSCGITNGVNGNLTGDPGIELATLVPQANSRVIDAGDNATCLTTDFNGTTRPIEGDGIDNARCDMGAFEAPAGTTPPRLVSIAATDASGAEAGQDPVTFTITRTGSTTTELIVSYTIISTADATDYTPALTGTATIPAGQASVDLVLTPVDDAIDELDETITLVVIDLTGYDPAAPFVADATIVDNDTAAIMPDLTGLVAIPEDDLTVTTTFTVAAVSAPTADVTITVTPDAQCAVNATPITLPAGSTAPVPVTVTAVNDATAEAAQHPCVIALTTGSADANFNGLTLSPVNVMVLDNDLVFTVTSSGPTFNEGTGTNTDVTFTITPGGTIANVGGSVSYTITDTSGTTAADDFAAPLPTGTLDFGLNSGAQTITVSVIGDTITEPGFALQFAITAMTAGVTGTPSSTGAPVSISVTDDDSPGFTVTPPSGIAVAEGGATGTFTVRLNTQPTADVTVNLTGTQVTTAPTGLTFTTTNWNTPQTVTVTAVDDADIEGAHTGSIVFTVTTTDPVYAPLTIAPVSISITDNDAAVVVPPPTAIPTTAPTLPPPPPPPCPNATIPAGSVVGRLTTTAQIYYAPGQASPGLFLPGDAAYWVTGLDSSGAYYQIILACQRLWVEVGAMGVNFEPPWFGRALPTTVIGG